MVGDLNTYGDGTSVGVTFRDSIFGGRATPVVTQDLHLAPLSEVTLSGAGGPCGGGGGCDRTRGSRVPSECSARCAFFLAPECFGVLTNLCLWWLLAVLRVCCAG